MILNIRGTSGSGKSTLARQIMALYGPPARVKVKGRKQPLMYICPRLNEHDHQCETMRSLAVIGHYESPCGGGDTIPSLDMVYQLVRQAHGNGYDVLFEGLLLSAEVNRCVALAQEAPVAVIALDVPLELCLASVNARRRERDPGREDVNPANTISKHKGTRNSAKRLAAAGVETHVCETREEALAIARRVLQV